MARLVFHMAQSAGKRTGNSDRTDPSRVSNAEAAPATVSGERLPENPLADERGEGGQSALTREPGDLPSNHSNQPSGVTARSTI
jgi:hypothetical protein